MGVVSHLVVKISASLTEFDRALAGSEKSLGRFGSKMQGIGRDLTAAVTLPLVGLGALSIKAAKDFESSFAGIRKTVDGVVSSSGQLTEFGRRLQGEFRALAKEIPISVNELNKIGESAGQLGIRKENILEFTRTIAAMGVSTNLSTDQAAEGMARFANVTQMPQENIERLGSTIVDLGNNLAATESEILEFGLRIAGAGEIVGLTEAQILGIAGAFSSVGVEAEAGGTAVQKALLAMNSAVVAGNAGGFGAAIGMSGAGFSQLFNTDPGEAFARFVEGVGAAGKQGETILRGVGIDDARQIRAFLSMAAAGDVLRDSLTRAGDAWKNNTALAFEAQQRYQTFESRLQLFKNQVNDVAITIGTRLIDALLRMEPAITGALNRFADLVDWFSRLPRGVQDATFAFGAFVAAVGPIAFVIGALSSAMSSAIGLFRVLGPVVSSALSAATGVVTTSAATVSRAAAAWRVFWTSVAGPAAVGVAGFALASAARDQVAQGTGIGNLISRSLGAGDLPPGMRGPKRTEDVQLSAPDPMAEYFKQVSAAAAITPDLAAFAGGGSSAESARRAFDERIESLARVNQPIFDAIAAADQRLVDQQFELRRLETTFDQTFDPVAGWMQRDLYARERTFDPNFDITTAAPFTAEPIRKPPSALTSGFNNALGQLPQTIMSALTGGGDVGRSVGGLFGGNIVSGLMGSTVGTAITGGLTSMLGSTIGGAIGSIIPGLGTMLGSMVGPLIGKLGGFFKDIFGGPSKLELEGRETAQHFMDGVRGTLSESQKQRARLEAAASGGSRAWYESAIAIQEVYAATGRTAEQALADFGRLLDATKSGAAAVQLEIDNISAAFREQEEDANRLQEAIQRYGFTLEELGPSNVLRELNEQSKNLIEDWRVLVQSGIDVSLVNERMTGAVNEYLAAALRTGTEVPFAMRPILEMMASQGLLTDAAGNKIDDLGAAGITFAETMTQGFDRVVLKLQQLIDGLQAAGTLISDLPESGVFAAQMDQRTEALNRYIASIRDTAPSLFGYADRRAESELARLSDDPSLAFPGYTPPTSGLTATPNATTMDQAAAATSGTAQQSTTVIVNAGTVVGNPDELAVMVADAVEGGGSVWQRWRTLTPQLAG